MGVEREEFLEHPGTRLVEGKQQNRGLSWEIRFFRAGRRRWGPKVAKIALAESACLKLARETADWGEDGGDGSMDLNRGSPSSVLKRP